MAHFLCATLLSSFKSSAIRLYSRLFNLVLSQKAAIQRC